MPAVVSKSGARRAPQNGAQALGKWTVVLLGSPASAFSHLIASLTTAGPPGLCPPVLGPLVPACLPALLLHTSPHTTEVPYQLVAEDSHQRESACKAERALPSHTVTPDSALRAWASLSTSCFSHPQYGHLNSRQATGFCEDSRHLACKGLRTVPGL